MHRGRLLGDVLRVATVVVACLDACPCRAATGDGPAGGVRGVRIEPDDIRQEDPSFYVHVDVDREDRTYREGDHLVLRVRSERDAHLHVLYRQADGRVFQIFPNAGQRDGRITAGRDVVIPEEKDTFRWQVGPPFGRETIKVIAADRPLDPLSAPELFQGRFNAVPEEKIAATRGVLVEADPRGWAESVVEITTEPRRAAPPPPPERRVGVFVGINEFACDEFHKARTDGNTLRLAASANDARVMAEVMAARCGIVEKLVLIDGEATREAIRAAVCDWLPGHSRPGDVVMFFLSSHGGQVADDDGDERDGIDEWLLVHDAVTLPAFVEMDERRAAGRLEPRAGAALDRLVAAMPPKLAASRRDPAQQRQLGRFLAHQTGITDDQFGHWLQRLAGRRVVVFLDTCHSGGFATNEKGIGPAALVPAFDFLDAELGRLKDLGQPDSSLISACGAREFAQSVRVSDELLARFEGATRLAGDADAVPVGVLAYEIGSAVVASPGITLTDAFERCRRGTARYFERYNALLRNEGMDPIPPHEPRFYEFSGRPLVLAVGGD